MTLPPLNVWIEHDGSAQCPLPVGTGHYWRGKRTAAHDHCECVVRAGESWRMVARYRVTSYPEDV